MSAPRMAGTAAAIAFCVDVLSRPKLLATRDAISAAKNWEICETKLVAMEPSLISICPQS